MALHTGVTLQMPDGHASHTFVQDEHHQRDDISILCIPMTCHFYFLYSCCPLAKPPRCYAPPQLLNLMLLTFRHLPVQVTYGATALLYILSIVTPSIWGPIQIIGATAGAVVGFIAPGMLALLPSEASLMPGHNSRWDYLPGCILIGIGILQGVAGVASQLASNTS